MSDSKGKNKFSALASAFERAAADAEGIEIPEGATMPEVGALLEKAEEFEEVKLKKGKGKSKGKAKLTDTIGLKQKPDLPAKAMAINEEVMDQAMQTESYAESMVSAAEMEAVETKMDGMQSEISELRSMMETLIAERESIPQHLKRIQEDINRTVTVLNETVMSLRSEGKMTAVHRHQMESGGTTLGEAADQVRIIRSITSDRPTTSSQLVHGSGQLKLKKRFAPVK